MFTVGDCADTASIWSDQNKFQVREKSHKAVVVIPKFAQFVHILHTCYVNNSWSVMVHSTWRQWWTATEGDQQTLWHYWGWSTAVAQPSELIHDTQQSPSV